MSPTIVALQKHLEAVRQAELERIRRRQVSFRPEQQGAIEELTRGIVTRVLNATAKVLECAPDDKEHAALLNMVHRMFNLSDEPAGRTNN